MRGKPLFTLVVWVLLAALPAVGGAQQTPGVTDKEVVVGCTSPLSGPAAQWGATTLGLNAWAAFVNERGGVHGRKIKVLLRDDAYNPARAMANLQEMKGQVFAVVGLLGTAVISASKDFFAENKIPLVFPCGGNRTWEALPKDKLRYVFSSWTDYEDEAEFLTNYAVGQLGAKKLALFYQNDDYGKQALEGMKTALSKLSGRAEMVAAVPYEVTDRALDTHALKLKESGADTLILYPTMVHAGLILKGIAKIGYRPRIVSTANLGDPVMFQIAGELWEGVYVGGSASSGIPGVDPAADKVVEIIKNFDPKIAGKEFLGCYGALWMVYVVEGLQRTGRALTVEAFIRAMESIKDWRPEGIGAPVTYGPDRRHGVNGSRIQKAEKGRYVPLTDYVLYKPRF